MVSASDLKSLPRQRNGTIEVRYLHRVLQANLLVQVSKQESQLRNTLISKGPSTLILSSSELMQAHETQGLGVRITVLRINRSHES